MPNIVSVIGARPQFIKASVVDLEFQARAKQNSKIVHNIVHTGQHFDTNMSNVFFNELGLSKPHKYLDINSSSHGDMTARMIASLETLMLEEKPDLCLIYGDTNSTLAAAIAAVKLHVPVGHVEAGIRRYDNTLPEEVNRRMSDQVCSLLFCSSGVYAENLRKENLIEGVFDVGDVTCDSYLHFAKHAYMPEAVKNAKGYVACTIHRPLNTDDPVRMGNVMKCLEAADREVILPLHPRSRKAAERYELAWPSNVTLLEPVSYFEMIGLLEGADFVMTDSGGLQKDAAFAGKHCMTFAPDTPWRELKALDVNRMVDDKPELVKANLDWAQEPLIDFQNPYGDGTASKQIVERVLEFTDRM